MNSVTGAVGRVALESTPAAFQTAANYGPPVNLLNSGARVAGTLTSARSRPGCHRTGTVYRPVFSEKFPSPLLAVRHHDQHHRYFKYNFATHFVVWDRLMNTLHPSYDDLVENGVDRRHEPTIESIGDILARNG